MSIADTQNGRIDFPHQLKLMRTQRGWSQSRLAQLIDTDNKTVSRWETGQVLPSLYFREKLCELFNLSLQEFGLLECESNEVLSVSSSFLFDPAIPLLPSVPLVGRDDQLSMLRQRLRKAGNAALSALHGLPGVGKTAISLHLTHNPELQAHFKNGILWAGLGPEPNLLGHLRRWAILLGMDLEEMSTLMDMEAWSTAIHHAIGLRTMLFVIDDVWQVEDVLQLKLGGPTCAYLITTRFSGIASQVAVGGATAIEELNNEDGLALLRTLAPQVVAQEAQRVRELVKVVGGLPLALTLIGNYLRIQSYKSHPRRIVTALELLSTDAGTRLDLQEPRSPTERHASQPGAMLISLRTIIAVTDQQLSEQVRAAFYSLSVFPPKPNSFDEEAALNIAGCTAEILDLLVDACLVQINSANRYMLHPLIADYACQQLEQDGESFDKAYRCLTAYFTSLVETHSMNYDLLEMENTNILATLDVAAAQDEVVEFFPRLICAFTPFLLSRNLCAFAEHHLQCAYQVSLFSNDAPGQSNVLAALEKVRLKQSRQEDGRMSTSSAQEATIDE